MSSVAIHPPKTPCTKGSKGIAKATLPNICKMPGPPAPFVPGPLPNIAKSGMSPKGYSKSVKIEGHTVAIRGASFKSMGDMASKATGGGLISANTHGPAKFITPGSSTVKIEGKSVHLLGEPMLNNCGASGSPPNTGMTMTGLKQTDLTLSQAVDLLCQMMCECKAEAKAGKYEVSTDPSVLDSHDPGDYSSNDFGIEKDSPGIARYQACIEKKLNNELGNTNMIPEQAYDMSTTPPSPVSGRPSGSRIPDVILLKGPGPAIAPNIDVIEMKFWDDESGYEDRYSEKHRSQDQDIGGGQEPNLINKNNCEC